MAAVPVWAALYMVLGAPLDLAWPLQRPYVFFQLVLVYPVFEELVFRGLLQGGLARRLPGSLIGPVSRANALTSLIFAASHLLYHAPLWAALAFVPSLVFGWARDRYRSLAAPMLLHVWYNLGYFLLFAP